MFKKGGIGLQKEHGTANRISKTRKRYFFRLAARLVIFGVCLRLYLDGSGAFSVLTEGFFSGFSPLHILWAIWVFDMFLQIVPVKNKVALGSQKLFALRFRPIMEKINYKALSEYVKATTKAAYKVFALWGALIAAIGALYYGGAINRTQLF